MEIEQKLLDLTNLTVGCTDVGAIGYAASIARDALAAEPRSIRIMLSHEIYKNSKNVGVPGTARRGPVVAALLGAAIGEPSHKLSIFHHVSERQLENMRRLEGIVSVDLEHTKADSSMWVTVQMVSELETVEATLAYRYDYLLELMKNGKTVIKNPIPNQADHRKMILDMTQILALVESIDKPSSTLLGRISINVDPIEPIPDDMETLLFALHRKIYKKTAKRMRGEVLPVVSYCGSGNLGIASANAIDALTRFYKVDPITQTKATALYLLIVQEIKESMTLLTVMCGTAIAAGAAAAGINLYLKGAEPKSIHVGVNQALSESLGTLCDGAKENCAAKTASRVMEGILQSEYVDENIGIVGEQGVTVVDVNQTIRRIAKLNNEVMEAVNQAILEMI